MADSLDLDVCTEEQFQEVKIPLHFVNEKHKYPLPSCFITELSTLWMTLYLQTVKQAKPKISNNAALSIL